MKFLLFAVLALSAEASVILNVTGTLSESDPTQTGRLRRDGVVSEWGSNKPFPGMNSFIGQHEYDLYTVTVPLFLAPVFYEVEMTAIDGVNMYVAAYTGAFVPSSPGANFFGDPGSSTTDQVFRVSLGSGEIPLLVVVHAFVITGAYTGDYQLTVRAYSDTDRTDLDLSASVPEPATFAAAAAALGALLLRSGLKKPGRQPAC